MRARERWQHKLWEWLAPGAWPHHGLSPVNKTLCVLIVVSSVIAILETEDTITAQAPRVFAVTETVFGLVFGLEYLARLWSVGVDPAIAA